MSIMICMLDPPAAKQVTKDSLCLEIREVACQEQGKCPKWFPNQFYHFLISIDNPPSFTYQTSSLPKTNYMPNFSETLGVLTAYLTSISLFFLSTV